MNTKKPKPIQPLLGKRVRERRHERGMTQERLGSKVGISGPAIHYIEAGTNNPALPTIIAIANALDVPLASLLE